MKIAELFHSLQGEGMLAGVPSVFIRTSGCNLRCRWCDTRYTSWEPTGEEMSVEAILEYVRQQSSAHVVVTGGEPMIAPEIGALCAGLRKAGRHITVETAGTVYAEVACDLMSVSPKLANSTPSKEEAGSWSERHEALRIQLNVLQKLMQHYACQLKFVVTGPEDLGEIRELLLALGAAAESVVLMPEGTDAETLAERGRWVAEVCRDHGYRYSPRLHIDLWGNRRGV